MQFPDPKDYCIGFYVKDLDKGGLKISTTTNSAQSDVMIH